MKMRLRAIHRDFGYFYVGLIISFALSGIMMNHRAAWHPEKYTIQTIEIEKQLPKNLTIDDEFVKKFLIEELQIVDKIKRHFVRKGILKIACENYDIEVDTATGKIAITKFIKTPFISQIMTLHTTGSNWWIYYSDIFGLSLITIAITGIFIMPNGRFSFKKRGWKLAVAGLIFPIIFLWLFS